jgi:hypothetical protein
MTNSRQKGKRGELEAAKAWELATGMRQMQPMNTKATAACRWYSCVKTTTPIGL